MSQKKNESAKAGGANRPGAAKNRRRPTGVPGALVALLVAVSLFFGGLIGFVVANRTSPKQQQLDAANARVAELENTLALMGFNEDGSNPEWVFDDSGELDEFGALGGFVSDDGNSVLWGENGMTGGELEATGEPVVVAEFNGGNVMSDEAIEIYNAQQAAFAFGFGDTAGDTTDRVRQVLEQLVAEKVMRAKADELGLTALSDADTAAIRAEAEAYVNSVKEQYALAVDTAGMTEEEAEAAVADAMEQDLGLTLEGEIRARTESYWLQKLKDEVTKDITVSDEEIQQAYDAELAAQRDQFEAYRDDYEFAVTSPDSDVVLYHLSGYRRVKQILIPFGDEEKAAQADAILDQIAELDPEKDGAKIAQLQEQLDPLYADAEQQADEVLKQLEEGANFDELAAQYGSDDGMRYEPVKSQGYYISAESTRYEDDFREGAMNLAAVGDLSVPVRLRGGVAIIRYEGSVTPGAVPLDQVREALKEDVLGDKQEAAFLEQQAQWIAEADAKYYPERLQ